MTETSVTPSASEALRQIIAERIPAEDFVVSVLADKVHTYLVAEEPELIEAWLHENARRFIADEIRNSERSRRGQIAAAARNEKPSLFAHAARRFQAGDPTALQAGTALRSFDAHFVVNEKNVRRRVADMTGSDHDFVASKYDVTGNKARMLASFHKAVARKVGDRKTSEVFSEDEYEEMLRQITV